MQRMADYRHGVPAAVRYYCAALRRAFRDAESSMRWFWVALAVIGIVVSFITLSPVLLAVALLVTGVSLFCAVFAFAAQRIEANARPDTALLTPEVLAHIREKAKRDQAARAAATTPKALQREPRPPQKFT